MIQNPFREMLKKAQNEGRAYCGTTRRVPRLNMTGCTIKLAQQNYGEHYKVMSAIRRNLQTRCHFPVDGSGCRGKCSWQIYGLPENGFRNRCQG